MQSSPFIKRIIAVSLFIAICISNAFAQGLKAFDNKQCVVVLTYDDAIDIDLDNVIPALDSVKLKGTFYLIGSSPVVKNRLNEWRLAAKNGHELGNHGLFHPCDGSLPGRSFVTPDHDLSKYTVDRAVEEIRLNNVLLKAIDGKDKRTYAYPCGDLTIGGVKFYDKLRNDFAGARGVTAIQQKPNEIYLDNISSFPIMNDSAEHMIQLVKDAQKNHTVVVFLFHGVGGGHNINVGLNDHRLLLKYLKANQKDIYISTMADVAERIKTLQPGSDLH